MKLSLVESGFWRGRAIAEAIEFLRLKFVNKAFQLSGCRTQMMCCDGANTAVVEVEVG
jgi:hypothetical protein